MAKAGLLFFCLAQIQIHSAKERTLAGLWLSIKYTHPQNIDEILIINLGGLFHLATTTQRWHIPRWVFAGMLRSTIFIRSRFWCRFCIAGATPCWEGCAAREERLGRKEVRCNYNHA